MFALICVVPEKIFKSNPSPSSLVDLGGVSGGGGTNHGIVDLAPNGQSQQYSILNHFCGD